VAAKADGLRGELLAANQLCAKLESDIVKAKTAAGEVAELRRFLDREVEELVEVRAALENDRASSAKVSTQVTALTVLLGERSAAEQEQGRAVCELEQQLAEARGAAECANGECEALRVRAEAAEAKCADSERAGDIIRDDMGRWVSACQLSRRHGVWWGAHWCGALLWSLSVDCLLATTLPCLVTMFR
jgi:chromosome segregation ATPase